MTDATFLLDITRTVARARLPVPTGIDRVERAYIGWVLDRGGAFLCRIDRTIHLVGAETVRTLVAWLDGEGEAPALDLASALHPLRDRRLLRAQALVRGEALERASDEDSEALASMLRRALPQGGVNLNVGHDNLAPGIMATLGAAGLRRVVLIHDVIPLDHPEFTRPGTPARFRQKLDAACEADLIVCNSAHTAERLRAVAGRHVPPVVVAPLGIDPLPRLSPVRPDGPAFVCLGTIEPRKNHALLLGLWDAMWQAGRMGMPVLHIVGRRGWENEAVFRVLDRAPMMGETVHEHGRLDDEGLRTLLSRARALLFPSFAEGYGLPLAEALALGAPVVASDLPALREVAGDVPDWLEPGDEAGWRRAIEDYASEPSARRAVQLQRMQGWQPPRWQDHFRLVANAMETILAQAGRGG